MRTSKQVVYNLRQIFELRKTRSLAPRGTVGRLFMYRDLPGLIDASGTIWPVAFSPSQQIPNPGTVVLCEVESKQIEGVTFSKYHDDGFLISVTSVRDATECRESWPNAVINAPQPSADAVPQDADGSATHYFSSTSQRRADRIAVRNRGIERTRQFFLNRGFTHMETPTLVPSGGVENYLSAFHTSYQDVRGKEWSLSLPTSPEFALKKLLSEGHSKIFQLSRSFRNAGELARWHEPEFLMLEWYRAGSTLGAIMDDTRELVLALESVLAQTIRLPRVWNVFKVNDLFQRHCEIDLTKVQDEEAFREAAALHSHSVNESDDWDAIFCKVFMDAIEPSLKAEGACFLIEYPRQMGALARVSKTSECFVDRFEAYLFGVEICNGYYELNDTTELEKRFTRIGANRPQEVRRDEIFERTMRYGLPPCSGNALGLDRVIALLAGVERISELMATPFLSQFPKDSVAPE